MSKEHQNGGEAATSHKSSLPLMEGEEVLVDARPAWSAYAGQLVFAGVVLIFGLLVSGNEFTGNAPLALALIMALAIVGGVFYQRRKVRYLVTDRRVVVMTGISSSSTNEAWMEDVRGMQTGASLLERFLGHGHVSISTSIIPRGGNIPLLSTLLDTLPIGSQMTLGGIPDYERVAQTIRRRQAERKMGSRVSEPARQPAE